MVGNRRGSTSGITEVGRSTSYSNSELLRKYKMAKFYVQSGNIQTVVSADDAEKAALWVIHKALQQVVPVYEDAELTPEEKGDVALMQGVMVLGNTIQISEIGFERSDAQVMDTFNLLTQWHQLMIALERLSELL